jgi:5-methylcytosine-specific restriction endonuclease McrA
VQFGPAAAHTGSYDWSTDAVKRAQLAGATVIDRFDRLQVFERDGWVCYRCERPTDPDASPFDVMSPTVDHVVPLSKAGVHTLANVRTCCLGCNSAKQDHAA